MLKTVEYSAVDKSALRKKGWKLFGTVVCLQLVFLVLGYAFH
ncbi:KGW motif small protein [Acinetobacter johnsonii]